MATSWNVELARAAEARINYYVSIGSSKEFMWRKAHTAILAVEKEIRRMPSGLIVNMPRLGEVTTRQELEAIIRGENDVIPEEMIGVGAAVRDFDRHPYLQRMQYRGGGYAILMALKHKGGFMLKAELIREAQHFCDVSMANTGNWGQSSSCGWASHRSLLQHRLMVASRMPGRGSGREEYSLTEDGRRFLEAMQRKWPNHGDPPQESSSQPSTAVEAGHAMDPPDRSRSPRGAILRRLRSSPSSPGSATAATPQRRPRWRGIAPPLAECGTPRSARSAGPRAGRMAEIAKTPSPLVAIFKRQLAAAASAEKSPARKVSIEVSSDEEGMSNEGAEGPQASLSLEQGAASVAPAAAMADIDLHTEGEGAVRLLVDQRERLKDSDPRGILNQAAAAVQGPGLGVVQHRLPLGDFLWAAGPDSLPRGAWRVLGCVLERKRVADLVGRSASGVHLRQLRRLELSGLRGAFLLIEGDQKHASSCPLYDACEDTVAGGAGSSGAACAIESQEDIEALCARLFVARSRVGVIATRDIEGTVRLLKNLTCWLQRSSSPPARRRLQA